MPRNGRGGRRQGTPGTTYPQRSDLQTAPRQAPTAAPNQTYGQAGQQLAAQRAVPLAGATPVPAAPPSAPAPPSAGAGPAQALPHFMGPTQRPDEPVTAGMPTGPGAGPEALSPSPDAAPLARLQAIYQQFPSRALLDLLVAANAQAGQ